MCFEIRIAVRLSQAGAHGYWIQRVKVSLLTPLSSKEQQTFVDWLVSLDNNSHNSHSHNSQKIQLQICQQTLLMPVYYICVLYMLYFLSLHLCLRYIYNLCMECDNNFVRILQLLPTVLKGIWATNWNTGIDTTGLFQMTVIFCSVSI